MRSPPLTCISFSSFLSFFFLFCFVLFFLFVCLFFLLYKDVEAEFKQNFEDI